LKIAQNAQDHTESKWPLLCLGKSRYWSHRINPCGKRLGKFWMSTGRFCNNGYHPGQNCQNQGCDRRL